MNDFVLTVVVAFPSWRLELAIVNDLSTVQLTTSILDSLIYIVSLNK